MDLEGVGLAGKFPLQLSTLGTLLCRIDQPCCIQRQSLFALYVPEN